MSEIPRLQYLQPKQYESWCRKVDDPEWREHRYRDAKDRAMVSAICELRDTLTALASKDAEIREEKARFYRIGFEDCRAQAMQVVDESDGYLSRIGTLEPTLTDPALATVPEGEK